ncbi:Pyrrolo-quinoline quinone [Rhodopirellula maiorica SM1]|uniref:Pyrrolo-quinoline quinone n=1 Tax=Rhodopirellula maiorica SM1 TaxID=1265738 RepID=M5RMD6_9BACT|nr:PQQ-binding-like beta-propeller repeat protein [Rhodopirellula maiorica]EMI20488.1 Pyrrolo-quinoline quinone [Rhodopirellula maiorica SM1]
MFLRFFRCAAVVVVLFTSFVCLRTSVAEVPTWPEFRGGHGDGHADAADLPVAIDASVVQWETPIQGKAWSSPVVWGDQIWLTTASEDGKQMSVVCVDRATGSVKHNVVVIENKTPEFCHPMNSYASPTPAIESGRLYAHFGSYGTVCVDTSDASVLWQRHDLKCDHFRGPASSPILHDGKLFVAYDGVDVQFVVAFDKNTGETVWQSKREIDYGTDVGDRMKAYGTAEVIQVGGQEQLVYPSAVATIAYDPQTGDPLWTVYHDGMNASARPIYVDGLVLITNGMGGVVAVRPDGKGNVTKSHVVWTSSKSVAKKSSPIVVDGLIYMITDDGIATCRELEDGKMVWQKRVGGSYAASPIYASGRIYLFSIEGAITTLQAGREYEILAETELGDGFMASPAVVGDQLILRSKSALYSIAN